MCVRYSYYMESWMVFQIVFQQADDAMLFHWFH